MVLTGKVVLVTGASSGIGEAIAYRFAREGGSVILCARREDLLSENVKKIRGLGGEALFVKADLRVDADVEGLVNFIKEKVGRIDILINNAGVALGGFIDDFSMKSYDDVMNINIRALYNLTKQVIPLMKAQREGIIISISSGSGKRGPPSQSAYAASKAAVIVFSESIAEELKPFNVKVHTICPGMVAVKGHYQNMDREKLVQTQDVADLVIYLSNLPQRVNISEVSIMPYYPINMLNK